MPLSAYALSLLLGLHGPALGVALLAYAVLDPAGALQGMYYLFLTGFAGAAALRIAANSPEEVPSSSSSRMS